jgi:Tol biopolymer transport system component
MKRSLGVVLAVVLALAAFGREACGFGQNKVQYRKLEWRTLHTTHFDVYFYEGEQDAATDAARMAERAYRRLSTILDHQMREKIPLILYASQSDFQTTNVSEDLIGEGTGGFTDFSKRRVTIPFTGGYGDLDHVLTHELVHAFQMDMLYGRGDRGMSNPFGAYSPPLWFMEGMAEYLSVTKVDNLTEMWLRDAALQGYLIPLNVLDYTYDIRVYRFGQSIFAYVGKTFGDQRIGELCKRLARTRDVNHAFQDVLGIKLEKFSDDWMEDVRRTYLPQILDYGKPEEIARKLTDSQKDMSSYHLAPAISPDGTRMVYISDRSLYNDLYLASALDGRIERRLIKGDRAEQFESLRFISASIDFAPDGGSIAFAAKAGKNDAIYIQRLSDRKILHRIRFNLDGVTNPSFSPDGKRLVFVGLTGGRSDLFQCGIDGSDLERLTDDRYLAQSPRYSPDGRSILFVTDQDSTTDFANLIFAEPRPAILDLETREVHPLSGMEGVNTAPQYFPDGRHVLYVSDRTGIPNIFIRDLETGRDAQLTNIMNGVNGIIPLAPAATLSRDGHRVVFSSFSRGAWDLYAIKDPLSMAQFDRPFMVQRTRTETPAVTPSGTPSGTSAETSAETPAAEASAGAATSAPTELPQGASPSTTLAATSLAVRSDQTPDSTAAIPRGRRLLPASIESLAALPAAGDLALLRHPKKAEADTGLAEELEDEVPLNVGEVFRLNRALPDTSGFKIDRYHVRFTVDYASAMGAYASNVGVAAQTVLSFSDVLGNNNLLVGADVYGSLSDSNLLFQYINRSRRNAYGFAIFQYRDDFLLSTAASYDEYVSQIYRGVELDVARPFSRFRRLEFSLQGMSLDEEVFHQAYYGDGYYDLTTTGRSRAYFFRPGVALVGDNVLWGYTGPIAGGRSSYSVDVALGDLQNSRWVVDWRRYYNTHQRYVLAVRGIGATSHGADPQIFRIGGPYTLHGIDYGVMAGNNVGLLNVELRFPLIQTLEFDGPMPLGFRGIRGNAFFDAGSAWKAHREFRAFDSHNGWHLEDIRASYGFGMGMNVGFAILRWDVAWPTDLGRVLGPARGTLTLSGDW